MTTHEVLDLKIEQAKKVLAVWLNHQVKAEAEIISIDKALPKLTDSEEDTKKKEELSADRGTATSDIAKAQNAIDSYQVLITDLEQRRHRELDKVAPLSSIETTATIDKP